VRFEEPAGVGGFAGGDGFGWAGYNYTAAGVAAFGAQVDDVIGGLDHVDVMLDQEDGVSCVPVNGRSEQP
jgi:hypothetical protein